jgi:hypothetical protein
MSDVIAADVPWPFRYAGANGVRLAYRVNGADAVMRELDSGTEVVLGFTLVATASSARCPAAIRS